MEELIDRTIEPCETALKDAKLTASDVSDVILVGGQTRMPKVQEVVQGIFGREPRRDVNPDEAVAMGAAIQAGVLAGDVKDVLLLDVTPLSLRHRDLGRGDDPAHRQEHDHPDQGPQQVFSTAENHQTAVTVHVLQGERERAQDNKLLGRFDLADIPPAPRGMPQIEVTFDIDANGILNVSAKDKATQREQSIVIRASSGLSEDEIERMVKDAEAHAEDDRKFRDLVDARNQADALIHAAEKSLADLGDEVGEEERKSVEEAVESLKEAVQGDDKEAIEAGSKALAERSGKLAERAYRKAEAAEGPAGGGGDGPAAADADVVDAEFEEVGEDRK